MASTYAWWEAAAFPVVIAPSSVVAGWGDEAVEDHDELVGRAFDQTEDAWVATLQFSGATCLVLGEPARLGFRRIDDTSVCIVIWGAADSDAEMEVACEAALQTPGDEGPEFISADTRWVAFDVHALGEDVLGGDWPHQWLDLPAGRIRTSLHEFKGATTEGVVIRLAWGE